MPFIKQLMSIDLNTLPKLLVLLKTGNVSKSAKYFEVSQPAMSRVLDRVRKGFSDPLLVRSGNNMVPTPQAHRLIPMLEMLVQQVEQVLNLGFTQSFEPAVPSSHFVIACDSQVQIVLSDAMAPLIARMQEKTTFQFLPISNKCDIDYMRENSVDIMICPPLKAELQLRSYRLYEEEYVCLARIGLIDNPKNKLSYNNYCRLPHLQVANMQNDFAQYRLSQATHEFLKKRNIRCAVHCFSQVPQVIAATDMVCLLPRRVARRIRLPANVVAVELDFASPSVEQFMYWCDAAHHDSASRWLRHEVIDCINNIIANEENNNNVAESNLMPIDELVTS